MELALDINRRYTYADYLTWTDGKMRELLRGVIRLMTPAPNTRHQRVALTVARRLSGYIEQHRGICEVFIAPFDVRLPQQGGTADSSISTVVQPDLCIVCDPAKIDERGCLGAPDMIIEIESPSSAKYDLRIKYDLYEEAGVREYWVVHQDKAIDVFLLQPNGRYDEGRFYQIHETIPVHTMPGCQFRLEDIYNHA
jgi:Uma2 family endonuclease